MSGLIVSVSGVRGIVGTDLNADVARRWGAAFAHVLKGKRVVVGRDSRSSGEELSGALIEGIVSRETDVVDAGLCSTPTLEVGIRHLGLSGGVMVTASHNPPEYNGLKFFGSDGIVVDVETGEKLVSLAGQNLEPVLRSGSATTNDDLVSVHVDKVLKNIGADAVRSARFKVVIDGCSSVGGPVLSLLLAELNCDVVEIDCEPSGIFTRSSEPRADVLGALSEAIKKSGADIGFAVDPDGDRLCAATGDGTVLSEEYTVPLVAMYVLDGTKGEKIGVNLSTSRMIEDVAARFGANVLRCPVGERNVVQLMMESGAVVGGEGNGGAMVPSVNPSRDAVVGAGYILSLLAESGRTLSDIIGDIPCYEMQKEKVSLSRENFAASLPVLKKALDGARFDTSDGLHASWSDRWIHIRPSGTEPVVRIIAEAPDKKTTAALVGTVRDVLP